MVFQNLIIITYHSLIFKNFKNPMSLGEKITDTLQDGLCSLLGIEEAEAYLTPIQVQWAIKHNPPQWQMRNRTRSLIHQCTLDR